MNDNGEDLTQELARFYRHFAEVKEAIHRIITGQESVVEQVLWALLAGGHVLLEGVPGLGKTVLVRTIAQVLGLGFSRIQFTPDLLPADVLGTSVLEERNGRRDWRWHPGPIFAHLVLADEINRATPKTQSALLEAMAEGQVTAGGATRPLPQPFFVLATQNPIEMEGTYQLPEAQVDRFMLKVRVPFPDEDTLAEIARRTTGGIVASPSPVVDGETSVPRWTRLARSLPVADEVLRWAVRLVAMSHPHHAAAPEAVRRYVRYGAGPRGLQAMLLAGKARALAQGRLNLAYEDLSAVARPALRHRLLLNFEGEAAGVDPDTIVDELIAACQERIKT